eukprot:GFUD01115811.1.p1 GENE.GFUD01115811.1~~GFUD01115811.1.p1  ORF type:complete len:287 (+),score=88.64 GFUD01115811.1:39-899(+)
MSSLGLDDGVLSQVQGDISADNFSVQAGTAVVGTSSSEVLDLSSVIAEAVRQQVKPLRDDIKSLRDDIKRESKKTNDRISLLLSQLTATQVIVKELLSNQSKEKATLKTLLKSEGAQIVRRIVLHSLHLKSGDAEEAKMIDELMRTLREKELIIQDSQKDVQDLVICFHQERNVLKQQVTKRIKIDLCNKSPETGAELTSTVTYLTSHGLGTLKSPDMILLYHLAYIHSMYMNAKQNLDSKQKEYRSRAEREFWQFLKLRVEKSASNDEEMKMKLKESLKNGFKPV